MSKLFIEDTTLTAIGDAIRAKTGKTDKIAPLNMATEISSISAASSDSTDSTGFSFDGLQMVQVTNSNTTTAQNSIDVSNYISSLDEIEFAVWQGFGATTQSTKYPGGFIYIPSIFGDKLIVFDYTGSSSYYLGYNIPEQANVAGISSGSAPGIHRLVFTDGILTIRAVYDDGTESSDMGNILCGRGTFTCWYKEA